MGSKVGFPDKPTNQVWIQEFGEQAVAFGWSDLDTLIAARKATDGRVKIWMSSCAHILTRSELKTTLQANFQDGTSKRELHELILKKKKGRDETMLAMWRRCWPSADGAILRRRASSCIFSTESSTSWTAKSRYTHARPWWY